MYGYAMTGAKVPLISQDQYTTPQYRRSINDNNYRTISNHNNINNYLVITNIDKDVWTDGIPRHFLVEYNKHLLSIESNILNANQNSLSSLNVQYIGYFYHVFPLHLNTYSRFFRDVIDPKLPQLASSVSESTGLTSDISDYISSFDFLQSSLTHSYKNLIKSISSYNSVIFIEPYIKILLDAIDYDIRLLNNLYDFFRIFNHHTLFLIQPLSDIQYYLDKYLEGLNESKNYENIIKLFKNVIPKQYFGLDVNIGNYYYFIRYWNTPSIKLIKSELESFKRSLESIKSNDTGYISKIKNQLEDIITHYLKSYRLTNIEELAPVTVGTDNLRKLLKKLKEAKSQLQRDQDYIHKQKLKMESEISGLNKYKYLKKYDQEKHLSKKGLDSLMKWFEMDEKKLEQYKEKPENLKKILHFLKKSEIIIDFQTMYIPNLTSKLDNAKSKLDKPKLINDILDKIRLVEIITTALDISKLKLQKSKFDEKMNKITLYIKTVDITLKLIEFIIERFKYINREILNTKSLNSNISLIKQHIQNIKYNIIKMSIIIKELRKQAENLIKVLESIAKTLNPLKCYYEKLNIKLFKNYIADLLREIENLKNNLEALKGLDTLWIDLKCKIESKLKSVESSVIEFECAIEGVARNLIRCSLQSTTNNTTVTVLNQNWVNLVDNQVCVLYSISSVMDYAVVINRLYDSAKKIDLIVDAMYLCYGCFCIESLEKRNPGMSDNYMGIKEYFFRDKSSEEIYKMKSYDAIKRQYWLYKDGNHMCLCLVLKYALSPQILNLVHVISYELDALSTLSRKFTKYAQRTLGGYEVVKILLVMVDFVDKLSKFIESRYKSEFVVSRDPVYLRCYCTYNNDSNYHPILNTVLVLSSLIENIWTMDPESIRASIECLSRLISEFEVIHSQKDKSTNLNIFKLSFVSVLSSSTQSCKLLAKLRIIIDFFSLLKGVPYLDSMIRPYIQNLSLCNIFRFDQVLKNIQDNVNNNNNNGVKNYIGWVLKKYQSVSWPCRGCNNSNCCCGICVNSIILWASTCIWLKVNIKVYDSNNVYKERLTNLLKCISNCGNDCCCKDLKDVCEKICGQGCGAKCPAGCPCKTLQETCKAICGTDRNCGSAGKCLCKLIDEIKECCVGGKQCSCATKGGCCRCPCCKLLGMSLKILVRACRANVLEPYKRIVMDLMSSSNNKEDLVRSILERVNVSIVNKAYLCKNNLLTHSSTYSYRGVKDANSSNWGYETSYEHDVTTQSNYMIDGYPSLYCRSKVGSSGKKMFKLVLSRLIIAFLIIGMFY